MGKKLSLMDRRKYAQFVEDAVNFVDSGGIGYPQRDKSSDTSGVLQKPIEVKPHAIQLWDAWKKQVEEFMEELKKEQIKI